MKMLLNMCRNTGLNERNRDYLFLFVNTVVWCVIGFTVWAIVSTFALKGVEWMITFTAYSGLIFGFIGGVICAWRE